MTPPTHLPLRILISGTSIAGPTLAYFLSLVPNTPLSPRPQITILERFPTLRPGGQQIDIRRHGVSVLRKIPGLEAAVRSKAPKLEGLSLVDTNGKGWGVMRQTGDAQGQGLVSEFEILRGDLSALLVGLTREDGEGEGAGGEGVLTDAVEEGEFAGNGVRYIFNEQISRIEQQNGETSRIDSTSKVAEDLVSERPVTVHFASGRPTEEYDLVVSCEGSTSRTRSLFFNTSPRAHMHPTNCWAAFFTFKGDLIKPPHYDPLIGYAHSSPGGRFIAAGVEAGLMRVTMMKIAPANSGDATAQLREALKAGDAALKNYVHNTFAGSGWITDDLLAGMATSSDLYTSEIVCVRPPSLHNNANFALVGDAGYAPGFTGTATSLALTGGYILAGEIGQRHRGDIAAGLRGYEQKMRPIITELSKQPPLVTTFMAPQTETGILVRSLLFAAITRFARVLAPLQGLWAAGFKKGDDVLPEYEWMRG